MRTKIIYILTILLVSCGIPDKSDNVLDASNKYQKIICVSKQYNEIICELGLDSLLVGIDQSSTYPEKLKKIPKVGYHRALTTEGIMSMKPELIIHDQNIGPEHVVSQLNELKVPMKHFIKAQTPDSLILLMKEMGAFFNCKEKAQLLAEKTKTKFMKIKDMHFTQKPRVLIIHYGRANNVYLVMTQNSTGGKIIEWAGGICAVSSNGKGMIPLSPELVLKADPDYIFITDYGYDKISTDQSKFKDILWLKNTTALKNNRIYRVEEYDFAYLSSRTPEVVFYFSKLLHP